MLQKKGVVKKKNTAVFSPPIQPWGQIDPGLPTWIGFGVEHTPSP